MKKRMSVGKIILIVLGVFIVWLSIRALMSVPGQQKILDSAVYLDEPVVLPENEGKMVIIHGKPEMIAPAYDEELGITINAFKAYRYAEEYKQTAWKDNRTVYSWASIGQKSIAGEASLGEFILDEKTIIAFPAEVDYEDFDMAEIEANGYNVSQGKTDEGAWMDRWYVIVGGPEGEAYYYEPYELNTSLDAPLFVRESNRYWAADVEGTKAYAYKIHSGVVSEEVTVAGIQQGNTLVAHEKLLGVVNNGVLTQEQLVNTETGYLAGGSIAFLVLGLLLVFLGLRKKNAKKSKKKNNAKRKKG
jgi:hypothetical protein